MTSKAEHRIILVVGIIFQILGIIIMGVFGGIISINHSIIGTYGLLLGFMLLLEGFGLVVFEIIRNRLKKKESQ